MPAATDPLNAYRHTADLSFFAATVHPIVTRVAMPFSSVSDAELALSEVRPVGSAAAQDVMGMINARLESRP